MKEYLDRIGVDSCELQADLRSLKMLQRRHLLSIPFENLDIHWKRPIALDLDKFLTKIVHQRRGGFCYELNGLFDELLRHVGFQTRLISGRVFNGKEHGPEFDHAAIIVAIGADEFLVDVGFGAFACEPLRFVLDEAQQDMNGTFVIRKFNDRYFEVAKLDARDWKGEYIFNDAARQLSDFAQMCDFQQFSSDSHFTKGKVCSIMTETGRKTLTDKNFIVTEGGEKKEAPVESELEFYNLLLAEFGISSINV
ncbi:MAG TPA: arylamine N-acetyltransferase [Pyrinomonadaceae bacterium]|nr:arylamine N-acetyltransferase [Pyrinomonadaceae bacterium]